MILTKKTDDDISYMRTQIWGSDIYDGLRDIFASLYARDGEHTHADAIKILSDSSLSRWDDLIDSLIETDAIDRYICDCLLPLGEHLDDWREYGEGIGGLLDDLDLALRILSSITGESLDLPRDGTDFAGAVTMQRLQAYRVIKSMVDGSDVSEWLENVTDSMKRNIWYLLCDDSLEHHLLMNGRDDYLYLSLAHSAAGTLVCGSDYWLEPLVVLIAEAAKATGNEALAATAIDDLINFLGSFETEHYADTRNDIIDRLGKLREGLVGNQHTATTSETENRHEE